MTDYVAGTKINALDFPPAEFGRDDTDVVANSTTYSDGSPQVSTTFVAPSSGRVLLTVGGGLRGDGTRRVHLAPVVKLTNNSGSTILSPNVITRGIGVQENATGYVYYSRTTLLDGLKPGQVYFAKVQHKASSGSGTSSGFDTRDIYVTPVS